MGTPLLAVLFSGNTIFGFFVPGPFKVKSTTSPTFSVRRVTYRSSGPDWLTWRKCAPSLLQLSLDDRHWALKTQVNNTSCTFDTMCDLPFFRALFAGGALSSGTLSSGALSGGAQSGGALSDGALSGGAFWVAGVSDVAEVRFFPADSQIPICNLCLDSPRFLLDRFGLTR